MNQHSSIASNRLVVNRDKSDTENHLNKIPARYLDDQKSELYKLFPFSNEISKSTFNKYACLSGVFKRPHRWTDLCDYCEKGVKLKHELIKDFKMKNFEIEENFSIPVMIEKIKKERLALENQILNRPQENNDRIEEEKNLYEKILINLNDFDSILFHKNVAKNQRIAYNYQIKNKEFLSGKILIECDFKQKILIGMSPRQINSEFYNQKLRSCLGSNYILFNYFLF